MTAIFENPIVAVVALILGFGFLIFVHELGHFAVAKWVGIRCTQFAIGFGTAMGSWRRGIGFRAGGTEGEYIRKAVAALEAEGESLEGLSDHARNRRIMEKADELGMGETEYRLNWLPLGGYVKMLGQEDMDPNAQSDDPRAFNRKPVWARAAVISAGVIMNLIFGLIFFIICFQIGVEFPAARVGGVVPGSPAATTYAAGHDGDAAYLGLQTGDRITHVNGDVAQDMADIKIATALGKGGMPVDFTVERDGEAGPLSYAITPVPNPTDALLYVGIAPPSTLTLGETADGKAAASTRFIEAGVEPGMSLVAVNGQPVDDEGDFERVVAGVNDPQLRLTFSHADPTTDPWDQVEVTASAIPGLMEDAKDGQGQPFQHMLGLRPVPFVVQVVEGGPAASAGLRDGDVIVEMNQVEWPTFARLIEEVNASGKDGPPVSVMRDGERIEIGRIRPVDGLIGVAYSDSPSQTTAFMSLMPGSPLGRATQQDPMPAGSRVLSVAGEEVGSLSDIQLVLGRVVEGIESGASVDVPFTFAVNLSNEPVETLTVTLSAADADRFRTMSWLPPTGLGFEPYLTTLKADGPVEATMIGLDKTQEFIQQTYITLLRLIQGTIKPSHLRGPVGIVDEGSKVARQGLAYFLFFLGLISVNLAVINFLPIPIVDGGLMVFLLIEKIKGSPASPKVQTAAMLVGLALIACVFLFVTYHDIARLVTG